MNQLTNEHGLFLFVQNIGHTATGGHLFGPRIKEVPQTLLEALMIISDLAEARHHCHMFFF